MMKANKAIIVFSVLLLIIMFFFFPSIYRYDTVGNKLTRTNRITGRTKEYVSGDWVSKENLDSPFYEAKLDADEIKKIEGKATILESSNQFSVEIYNGTDETILIIEVRITLFEKDLTPRWDRRFTLKPKMPILPKSRGIISAKISDCKAFGSFNWDLESVWYLAYASSVYIW